MSYPKQYSWRVCYVNSMGGSSSCDGGPYRCPVNCAIAMKNAMDTLKDNVDPDRCPPGCKTPVSTVLYSELTEHATNENLKCNEDIKGDTYGDLLRKVKVIEDRFPELKPHPLAALQTKCPANQNQIEQ